jgi:hypothetical protein
MTIGGSNTYGHDNIVDIAQSFRAARNRLGHAIQETVCTKERLVELTGLPRDTIDGLVAEYGKTVIPNQRYSTYLERMEAHEDERNG